MKAFLTTIAILAATAFVAPVSFAADSPGALAGYGLPIGANLKQGYSVVAVANEDFQKAMQALNSKLEALPQEKREAFVSNFDISVLPAYDADLWDSKEAYEAYRAAFKQTQIQPAQEVLVSLQPLGKDMWRLNSVTVDARTKQAAPLTLGALTYDAHKNTWTSNNGPLVATPYSATEDNIYGAQTGTEWSLENTDDFSTVTEKVRFTKTADGKYVYISYEFQEKSLISGASLARGGYVLRFPLK